MLDYAAASLFCACLESVQSAPCVIAGSMQELYTCLRQMARLLLKVISIFGECRPACHDSLLYILSWIFASRPRSVASCNTYVVFNSLYAVATLITFAPQIISYI